MKSTLFFTCALLSLLPLVSLGNPGARSVATITNKATPAALGGRSDSSKGPSRRFPASPAKRSETESDRNKDSALERHEEQLLQLAFDTATAIPVDPHIKERSKVQRGVLSAALELDQPARASLYAGRIENWRRGEAQAELACYYAKQGRVEQADHSIGLAQVVLDWPEKEFKQAWRSDRIRAKVAEALFLLGRFDDSAQMEADLAPSETGKVDAIRAALLGEEDLEGQLHAVDQAFLAGNLDQVRSALDTAVQLFDRFYDNKRRRTQIQSLIDSSKTKAPRAIFIGVYFDLADKALRHAEPDYALELLATAEGMIDGARWLAQDKVPMLARLAQLLHESGEQHRATEVAESGLAAIDEVTDTLMAHYRAEALRPLAGAFLALGDERRGTALYRRLVEDGAANENARPRALALTATCLSMLAADFQPPEDLMARLHQIHEGLRDPW